MSYNTKFNIFLILLFIGYVAVDKYIDANTTVQPQIIIQKDTVLITSTDTIYTPPTIIKHTDESENALYKAGNASGLQDNNTDGISAQPTQKDSNTIDCNEKHAEYYELEYKGKVDSTDARCNACIEYTLTMGTQTIPYWYKLELQTHIPSITVKETDQRNKHWTISPQVGIGYGVFHSKFDVYCGIGVAYNF